MTFTLPGLGGAAWGPVNNDALSNLNERVTDLEIGVVSDAFKPSHAYSVGNIVQHTDGTWLQCITAHTSGSTIDLSKFEPVSTHAGTVEQVALSATYVPQAGGSLADYAVASRLAGATTWVTKEEHVARALGWKIVTDPRHGGGAKGDVQGLNSVSITSGQVRLTRNTGSVAFTSADVGKKIAVAGAGAAGAALVTTIAAFVDATHVDLAASASSTVSAVNGIYGTDDTTAIQAAMTDAKTKGGTVWLPPGGYFAAGLVVSTGVVLRGSGIGSDLFSTSSNSGFKGSWLMTTPGANTDLLITENFATLTGTNTTTGAPQKFGVQDVTLDGLHLNNYNTSGYVARFFGSSYLVSNVYFQYGSSGGVWTEWGTGGYDMECAWHRFWIKNNGGHGLRVKGPHDGLFCDGVVSGGGSGQYGIYVDGGKAAGSLFCRTHVWGSFDWCWYVTAGSSYLDCKGEGGTIGQFLLGASDVHIKGGEYFNGATAIGIQIGDTALFPSHYSIDTVITGCQTPIKVVTDSGYGQVRALVTLTAAGGPVTGSFQDSTRVDISADNAGGTAHEMNGQFALPGTVLISGTNAAQMQIKNAAGQAVATWDTSSVPSVATLSVISRATATADVARFQDRFGTTRFGVSESGIVLSPNNSTDHVRCTSGRTLFDVRDRSSAVNMFEIANQVTGSGPTLSAIGSDTNVDVVLVPKGAAAFKVQQAGGNTVMTVDTSATSSTPTLILKPFTGSTGDIAQFQNASGTIILGITTGGIMLQANASGTANAHIRAASGRNLFDVRDRASAVNIIELGNQATGSGPTVAATGSDTNIDVQVVPKGTGVLNVSGPVKPTAVATGSRPSAASAGVGGMIYDTTLSKPIWSDGTTWRDAMGTAV